ncbi:hypothetical protein D1BOALGB6SA_1702 [Olavius sp. associated proteobacterium Delta 1]|nr:hypothetical protein D1BOALGB6SA_1702 [Olavius sp. associated proteobacterium Delta 1]
MFISFFYRSNWLNRRPAAALNLEPTILDIDDNTNDLDDYRLHHGLSGCLFPRSGPTFG